MPFLRLLLLLLALPALSALAEESSTHKNAQLSERAIQNRDKFYDEIFDAEGKVRPHYEDIWRVYLRIQQPQMERFRSVSREDFRGDNALSPLPKVMTESEYKELERGVDQRARAALAFLEDHYSGRRTYTSFLPPDVMGRIMERAGETGHATALGGIASQMRFPYGSDLIRGANGKFYEIEFNSGFVGGFGDLRLARNILFERIPEYRALLGDTANPEKFYKTLIDRYKESLRDKNDLVVFLSKPPYVDNEDARLNRLWSDAGAVPVQTGDKEIQLVKKPDGLYVKVTGKRAKELGWPGTERLSDSAQLERKVGFAIVNGEFGWMNPQHELYSEKYWVRTAKWGIQKWGWSPAKIARVEAALKPDPRTGRVDVKKLVEVIEPQEHIRNSGFPGLVDAILKGEVGSNISPGTEILSDKELHTYFEDIIRHYLKEEPIIRNLPTERFYLTDASGKRVVNEALLDDTIRNLDRYVVKVMDGRGGKGVWVGAKTSPAELEELKRLIRAEPDRYIRQLFSHLSTADQDITDVRMLAQVGAPGSGPRVVVSETPWARALPMTGNGKVNLSGDGHEMTVFVRPDGTYPKRPIPLTNLGNQPCPLVFRALSSNY